MRPSKRQPEAGEPLGVLGEAITSPQNALVKRAASLRQRKFREREGAFLVEGADLVLAGIAAGQRPQTVFVAADRADEFARLVWGALDGTTGPVPGVFPVAERVAAKISSLEQPPDAMAVFALPSRPVAARLQVGAEPLVVYADGVADPGNMGTLVRAAAAFGAAAFATSPGSTDLFSPKTVRASMGAIFGLPLVPDARLGDLLAELSLERVYGLAAHEGMSLRDADLRRPAALIVGAERSGISPTARAHVTDLLTIPMAPGAQGVVESLNAGVAGAIALYELSCRFAASAHSDEPLRPPRKDDDGRH